MGFQAEAAMESARQTPRTVSQPRTGTTQRSSPNRASIGRNQPCQNNKRSYCRLILRVHGLLVVAGRGADEVDDGEFTGLCLLCDGVPVHEGIWEHLRQGVVVDPAVDCFDGAGRDEGLGRDGGVPFGVQVAVRAARRQPAAVSSDGPQVAGAPELTVVATSQ
jgi:hypothetical protein